MLRPVACCMHRVLAEGQLVTIAGGLIGGFFATNLGRSTIAGIEGVEMRFSPGGARIADHQRSHPVAGRGPAAEAGGEALLGPRSDPQALSDA